MPRLIAAIPPAIKIKIISDRTLTIRAAVEDVQITLMITILLVVMVIFTFLRELLGHRDSGGDGAAGAARCLCADVGVRLYPRQSVADGPDHRRRLRGRRRHRDAGEHHALSSHGETAARRRPSKGASEIGFTIVSISVSLVAVLIPLLLMGGIIGRLLRIRGDAGDGDLRLPGGVADADADDGVALPGARAARPGTAGFTSGASARSTGCLRPIRAVSTAPCAGS